MLNPQASRTKNLFLFFLGVEALIGITSIMLDGTTLEALHTTTRWSGRLSLLFFSLMLMLHNRPEASSRFVSSKPFLLFAVIHGIHLIELLFYVQLSGNELIPIRLLGGFVGYVLIFIMPYLLHLYQLGKLSSKAFRISEFIYYPYLWFIFFMSYLPRVMKTLPNIGGAYWEHVTLFIWVILLGIMAIVLKRKLVVMPQT